MYVFLHSIDSTTKLTTTAISRDIIMYYGLSLHFGLAGLAYNAVGIGWKEGKAWKNANTVTSYSQFESNLLV